MSSTGRTSQSQSPKHIPKKPKLELGTSSASKMPRKAPMKDDIDTALDCVRQRHTNLQRERHYRPSSWDKVHQKQLDERVSDDGSDGVLLIDGWKNSSANTKNVVCTLHSVSSKSTFLKSWGITGLRETGEQLKEIVNEKIKLAKEKFKVTTYTVVSDNASPMISMGKKVEIWHTLCHSHSGNLLAKAFVSDDFAKTVNELLHKFKSPSAEYEIKQRGESRIMLACDTWWCSYRDAFRCLLKNLHLMQALVDEKKIQLNPKYERLRDPSFAIQLQDFILIFDPICQLINVCQESDCSIAKACEEWLKLVISTANDQTAKKIGQSTRKSVDTNCTHSQFPTSSVSGQTF
ncbi:membrane-bound transcription factor site-2 protease-like protein [Lasius niger]|uniref:Membrane-bound transcription factor site-2 protease-like protein n=1 Tax=Lasius niger TaxID=67767 RepID=A0A0J7KGQ3_LASNI|nr:membrane-bound transcription factor site-2 protease-like protein [Lasius niger]